MLKQTHTHPLKKKIKQEKKPHTLQYKTETDTHRKKPHTYSLFLN